MYKQRLIHCLGELVYQLDYMPDGDVLLIHNEKFVFSGYTVIGQVITIDTKLHRVMWNDELFAYYLISRN